MWCRLQSHMKQNYCYFAEKSEIKAMQCARKSRSIANKFKRIFQLNSDLFWMNILNVNMYYITPVRLIAFIFRNLFQYFLSNFSKRYNSVETEFVLFSTLWNWICFSFKLMCYWMQYMIERHGINDKIWPLNTKLALLCRNSRD